MNFDLCFTVPGHSRSGPSVPTNMRGTLTLKSHVWERAGPIPALTSAGPGELIISAQSASVILSSYISIFRFEMKSNCPRSNFMQTCVECVSAVVTFRFGHRRRPSGTSAALLSVTSPLLSSKPGAHLGIYMCTFRFVFSSFFKAGHLKSAQVSFWSVCSLPVFILGETHVAKFFFVSKVRS